MINITATISNNNQKTRYIEAIKELFDPKDAYWVEATPQILNVVIKGEPTKNELNAVLRLSRNYCDDFDIMVPVC